jgi:hypothetical protein
MGRSLIIISLYLNFNLPSQVDWEVYDVDSDFEGVLVKRGISSQMQLAQKKLRV